VGGLEVIMTPRGQKFVEEGTNLTLAVMVSGGIAPFSYEWLRETNTGMLVPVGLSTPSLELTGLEISDSGRYFCRVSDGSETVDGPSLRLEVVDQLSLSGPWTLVLMALLVLLAGGVILRRPARNGVGRC
jgi:hypothetical protein